MWFRRDLRLADNPALLAAAHGDGADGDVLPLFVVDPALWGPSGPSRRHYLSDSLRDLDSRIGLTIRTGDPVVEVVRAAREVEADRVHVAADFGPYGRTRDEMVDAALAEHDIELVRTGSPYLVSPGRVTKDDGTPYKVFTPFYSAWKAHGWRAPATTGPKSARWIDPADVGGGDRHPRRRRRTGPRRRVRPRRARRGRRSSPRRLEDYADDRNRPDIDGTSRMSAHLKFGTIHPRTMAADLGGGKGAQAYLRELAFRDFYADVRATRGPTARGGTGTRTSTASRSTRTRTPRSGSRRGRRARPASRSSTPACGSSPRPASCTTGCG